MSGYGLFLFGKHANDSNLKQAFQQASENNPAMVLLENLD